MRGLGVVGVMFNFANVGFFKPLDSNLMVHNQSDPLIL